MATDTDIFFIASIESFNHSAQLIPTRNVFQDQNFGGENSANTTLWKLS